MARSGPRMLYLLGLLAWSGCAEEKEKPAERPAAEIPEHAEPAGETAAQVSQAELDQARSLAQSYMKRLKGELQKALKEGGPVEAISICAEAAPSIAGALSSERDWAVGRTALRVRNPRNAPSVRERGVLMRFKARAQAGESLEEMEEAAVLGEPGARYVHYMKAIPTGGVCVTCHGESLTPELREAIEARYPADAATGFQTGELRGAFTFVKPRSE